MYIVHCKTHTGNNNKQYRTLMLALYITSLSLPLKFCWVFFAVTVGPTSPAGAFLEGLVPDSVPWE